MRTKRKETMLMECCKLLVFGGMEKECIRFYKKLAEMIADIRKVPTLIVTNNIRTLICFSLLRSMIRCLRVSRIPRYSHINDIDIKINALIKID